MSAGVSLHGTSHRSWETAKFLLRGWLGWRRMDGEWEPPGLEVGEDRGERSMFQQWVHHSMVCQAIFSAAGRNRRNLP